MQAASLAQIPSHQLHASAGILSSNLKVKMEMKCQVPVKRLTTLLKRRAAMPDTPTEATTAGGPLMLMEIARTKESRISPHQPTVPFSAHHEETRQRMKRGEMSDQRVDQVSFTIYAILYKGQCDCLRFSKYRGGFVPN